MSKGKRHTPRPYPGLPFRQMCTVCGAWRDYNRNSYGPWVRDKGEYDPVRGRLLPVTCPSESTQQAQHSPKLAPKALDTAVAAAV